MRMRSRFSCCLWPWQFLEIKLTVIFLEQEHYDDVPDLKTSVFVLCHLLPLAWGMPTNRHLVGLQVDAPLFSLTSNW